MKKLTLLGLSIALLSSSVYADRVQVVPRSSKGDGGYGGVGQDRREESGRGRSEGRSGNSGSRAGRSSSSERVQVVPRQRYQRQPGELSVSRNRNFHHEIMRRGRVEVVPNRYYWHTYGGHRYAHYYGNGRHWYGFYHGPRFYWTQYYRDRYWWYDPMASHWTFWWNGYWWWGAPGGAYYVYINDTYQPYEVAGVDVPAPEYIDSVPEGTPPESTGDKSVSSPDGKLMVQIAGDQDEAYLYNTTGQEPVFVNALGQKATHARFSGGTDGKALQILVDFQDGHFQLFNDKGEPLNSTR